MLGHSRPARGPVQPAAGRTDCEWVLDSNPDLVHTKFGWAQTVQNSIFVCLDPKIVSSISKQHYQAALLHPGLMLLLALIECPKR